MKKLKSFEEYGEDETRTDVPPTEANFWLFIDDGEDEPYCDGNGDIGIYVEDLKDTDNDNIQDVENDKFKEYWNNSSENLFLTKHFKTKDEARVFLVSIGMVETDELNW